MQELRGKSFEFSAPLNAAQELVDDVQKEFGGITSVDLETIRTLEIGLQAGRDRADAVVEKILYGPHQHAEHIKTYIQVTRLLVNCLNVDAYITSTTRTEVVGSLFVEVA